MSEVASLYHARVYENEGLPQLVALVAPSEQRVLDLGCGNGANMRILAARGHKVCGVTLSHTEAQYVRNSGLSCVVADLMADVTFEPGTFDALLCSHVLEHLVDPATTLGRWSTLVRSGGSVYVALPNVVHLVQRWQFALGRFRYTETGLMDRTHLRFFDFMSARQLLETAGLTVVSHFGVGQCPLGPLRRTSPALGRKVDEFVSRLWPALFAFHIVMHAKRA